MKAIFDDLLQMLGAEVGIDALVSDENGSCSLAFDDVVVNMEYLDDISTLFLYAAVASVTGESKNIVMEELLDANCFYKSTQGASFGLDRATQTVMLQHQAHIVTLEYGAFRTTLQNFINVAEIYKKKIESGELYKKYHDVADIKIPLGAAVRA